MVHAVANAQVPKFTVIVGATSARELRHVRTRLPRPTALDVAECPHLVMGGEQAPPSSPR
jgi:acetyl-CoA carboxylase carboxyltransferase component